MWTRSGLRGLLFDVLCGISRINMKEDATKGSVWSGEEGQQAILVSQLKPLLQRNWHNTFDEVRKQIFWLLGEALGL